MKQPRLVALQHRDFRLLWTGRLLSTMGSQMQQIAISWHVFELLRGQTYELVVFGRTLELNASAIGLGSLGLARVIPIIIFALLGGLLADARDRRTLLIWVQTAAALFSATLALLTFTDHITIPMIYLLSAALAAASAFDEPARQSIVPNLVPREHLANAVTLNTVLWQIATIVGPGLAGLLVGQFDVGLVYALDAISFGAVIVSLLLMEYRGQAATQIGQGLGWAALVEGVRFTLKTRLIRSTMLLDFWATFFASARTMLPIVATDVLKLGVEGYGFLATAQPVGALIAGAIVALRRDIRRQGVVLLISVGVYGVATALFGLSTSFALSYILFGLTGAGDTVSTVIRGTLRQLLTPDHLRGRMTSVNMVFFMGGPQLGELEAGLVASLFGAPVAIFTGGVATVLLTALIAWRYPRLRNYTSDMADDLIKQAAA
ncbi:MAG: MFS transporter [Ardenticatenaceae bacterium]|nr:MFS transporter [Anaerolineales bacterium]MCB8938783.1 MFS transporter [Ardenticatenaceae bacterium]MCB8974019.1 MFS transporter [Ardenticatenaceae bacterium]